MSSENIRNFSIIAHIDHGKSTLADRLLEVTGTIEKRKMKEQVLDDMDIERERGITIKMTPVRMPYILNATSYILNLIDTPGHIDFSYEVSRSLKAVEGALLLVDATQGVQAQTLSVLSMAKELGLTILPVVTKIDSSLARTEEVSGEIVTLLDCSPDAISKVSGKTGEGVSELLERIVREIPAPKDMPEGEGGCQALVFDFEYSTHRGIIVYTRVFGGTLKKGDRLTFAVTGEQFQSLEMGTFSPHPIPKDFLSEGEIGYIVTGIKEPGKALVGDTITSLKNPSPPLSGYAKPQSVVWASLYPESQDEFLSLRSALLRLKLSDSALSFEEEMSPSLGRGFRCGFLGMLHLEIVVERLKREANLPLVVTSPTIVYEIEQKDGSREKVYSSAHFPEASSDIVIYEPWALVYIITPQKYVGDIVQLLYTHEAVVGDSESFSGERVKIKAEMPLRELMRGFFDEIKSTSSGYASFSYEIGGLKKADVVRLDIVVADEVVPAFSQIISRARIYDEAKRAVDRLSKILPRQLFTVKIQGRALGRILSSQTLTALKKDVTGYLYGGDITRKRKLWEKQKKGKKKMKERGKVSIPHDVFLKMVKME